MRLADAILIGNTLKVCDPSQWLDADGNCGCALGGAVLASGVDVSVFEKELEAAEGVFFNRGITTSSRFAEIGTVTKLWPWINAWHVAKISTMYYEVADGTRTIESLAAIVDSWEPHIDSQESVTNANEENIPSPVLP